MAFGPHLLLAVLEGLVSSAVLALTALGLSLVFGVMRIVNVAHGEFFMLGAVFAWWFSTMVAGDPALGFLLALVLAPLVVGLIALVAERLVLRRLDYFVVHPNYRMVYRIRGETVSVMAIVHTSRQWPPAEHEGDG